MKNQLDLPFDLKPYQKKIEKSIRPYVHVLPQAENKTAPWESKIGGTAYLPKGMEIPKGENGAPLYLLAQINFSEVPELKPFPADGLLQFFIADHSLYGFDMENPAGQKNFRLRFFGHIDKSISLKYSPENIPGYSELPISPEKSFPLKFEIREEAAPLSDYRIENFLEADFFAQYGERKWEVMEAYSKTIHSGGHKLGGYSFFTQNDPRKNTIGDMEQLLQIDSDQNINCQWGDMGTAHFFIKKDALENLDFSQTAFWWDCY